MDDWFGDMIGDVTIHLVEKPDGSCSSGEQAGSKRKRNSTETETKYGFHIGKMKAESDKLRRYSKYFETCLSERWEQSKRPPLRMEFYLEAQARIPFYAECISRMRFLHKPIPSVDFCIELLKVASQIVFQDLLELGVKYLSAAVWSADEEKQIREFYEAGHLSHAMASDLKDRLDELPLDGDERQKKLSECAQKMLSFYLRHAIPDDMINGPKNRDESLRACPDSSIKFAGALDTITSGICDDDALKYALSLVKNESERLMRSIADMLYEQGAANECIEQDILNLCWLFKVSRRANAAQAIVQALVRNHAFSSEIKDAAQYFPIHDDILRKLSRVVIGPIFQDVMDGGAFLDTDDRTTLFNNWCWSLKFLDLDEERIGEIVTRFVMTLPRQEQEKFWIGAALDTEFGPSTEVHNSWFRCLVSKPAPTSQVLVIPCDDDSLCESPV